VSVVVQTSPTRRRSTPGTLRSGRSHRRLQLRSPLRHNQPVDGQLPCLKMNPQTEPVCKQPLNHHSQRLGVFLRRHLLDLCRERVVLLRIDVEWSGAHPARPSHNLLLGARIEVVSNLNNELKRRILGCEATHIKSDVRIVTIRRTRLDRSDFKRRSSCRRCLRPHRCKREDSHATRSQKTQPSTTPRDPLIHAENTPVHGSIIPRFRQG